MKAPSDETSASDDMRLSAVKKNVGTMEELHKKCKGNKSQSRNVS